VLTHSQGVLDDDEFEGLKQHLLGLDDEADDGQPAPAPAPPDPSAASAAAELSEERRRRRRERKRRKEAKAARLRQEKRGPRQPESEASRQLALIDVAETSSRIGPNQRAPVYTDELVILPTSRLKTLRTDAMVKRAVERVKTSLRSASVDDVGDWLCALGLEAYASTFKDSAVDGQLLAELTDDQLRDDLSVHKIGDRAKIRRARDAILSGQVTSLKGVDGGADQADAIISPSEEAKKQRRWLGHERIKVQARLSSADPWMNMKISAGELGNDLEQFRERLASSLQVHESALGHLEYMDTNGDWFACMNEYDVWDGVAEQGGRALVLQVVEARAPGFQVGEAFDHDGRRSLVDVAPGGGGGPEMSQPKDMQLSLDGSLGTAAEGGFGGTGRPESTEQLNLLMKALLRRGAIDDAVAELKSWLGARGQKLTEQPYNTLLKLALDDHLPSSAATSILNSMEDSGVTVGARSYQYALRILVASGDLQDAADILRKMEGKGVQPDSAAYEKLVQGLAERGDLDMSLLLAKQASKAGTRLGINCLGFLLNSCTQKKAKQQGLATFKLIQKAKLGITQEIFASVIKCACAAGDLEMASDLLKDSIAARHTPGILTFNAVLKLCTDQKANNEAVRTFKRLSKAPAEADEESYGLLLQCTSTTGDLALSSKILQEMVSLGFYPSILTCNNLLAMCADQHARTEAVSIFKYMQMSSAAGLSPNAQSYEYLIAVGVNVNDTQFVVQVVKHMVSAGFAPTAARASELLDVCAQNRGQGAQVLSLYKLMQSIALQAERLVSSIALPVPTPARPVLLRLLMLLPAGRRSIPVRGAHRLRLYIRRYGPRDENVEGNIQLRNLTMWHYYVDAHAHYFAGGTVEPLQGRHRRRRQSDHGSRSD
jgi:pentatricopeptide repeat protein